MKKIFYILAIFNLILLTCYAQPSIIWNRLYDGGFYQDDIGNGICRTTDGNYLLGGNADFNRAMFIKIDQYGNIIWQKIYDNNWCQDIAATSDGGAVFVAGGLISKLNSTGDTTWGYYYSVYNISSLYDVIQCTDGGYVACGSANSYNSLFIMKVDSGGKFIWQQTLPSPGLHPGFVAVSETYSNDYIAAGRKYAINYRESVMGRFGINGDIIWVKSIGEGDSLGSGIRIIKQSPYYTVPCQGGYIKVDDSGEVITAKRVQIDFNYGIVDMQFITNDKFVMVTNNLALPGKCSTKVYIEDTLGNILSTQEVLLSDFVRLNKIVLTNSGDIIFGGDAARYDTSSLDFYALRCDSNLNFPPIGIKRISETIPDKFILCQNYPNPFNPTTKIKFDIPPVGQRHAFDVRMIIYDVLGREVTVLVNQQLSPGTYEVEWSAVGGASNYPSGVYFYMLEAGDFVETRKMVLIK